MPAPLLEVKNLAVRYSPKLHAALNAVEDVSFTIAPGEFVGLIGESGSGKSTLANAILRLTERPGRIAAGQIMFDGLDITSMSQEELRHCAPSTVLMGLLTGHHVDESGGAAALPVARHLNCLSELDELAQPCRPGRAPVPGRHRAPQHAAQGSCRRSHQKGAVVDRIKELFDLVMIDHRFIHAYPHELSGGMKQRVNLALALANDPKFILLDEPTTGLDVVVQRSILENVRQLQREQGFAVLFISHDIGTVLDMSDRILVMYAGRIVEENQTRALLRDPLHPYSKGLLGSYADPRNETVRITYVPGVRRTCLASTRAACSPRAALRRSNAA